MLCTTDLSILTSAIWPMSVHCGRRRLYIVLQSPSNLQWILKIGRATITRLMDNGHVRSDPPRATRTCVAPSIEVSIPVFHHAVAARHPDRPSSTGQVFRAHGPHLSYLICSCHYAKLFYTLNYSPSILYRMPMPAIEFVAILRLCGLGKVRH